MNLKSLSLATKESYLIFNNILYKGMDGVVMESLLESSLANAVLAHYEQNCLDSCPLGNYTIILTTVC